MTLTFTENVEKSTVDAMAAALNSQSGIAVTLPSTRSLTVQSASTGTLLGGTAAPTIATASPTAAPQANSADDDNKLSDVQIALIVLVVAVAIVFCLLLWFILSKRAKRVPIDHGQTPDKQLGSAHAQSPTDDDGYIYDDETNAVFYQNPYYGSNAPNGPPASTTTA